jgi:hypothetical protein
MFIYITIWGWRKFLEFPLLEFTHNPCPPSPSHPYLLPHPPLKEAGRHFWGSQFLKSPPTQVIPLPHLHNHPFKITFTPTLFTPNLSHSLPTYPPLKGVWCGSHNHPPTQPVCLPSPHTHPLKEWLTTPLRAKH